MPEEKIKFLIRSRALIVHDGKLLVVKHRETDNYFATPGGHIEKSENPQDCIIREIKEEFGVEIKNPKLAYIYTWNGNDGMPNIEFFFLIKEGSEAFLDTTSNNRSHGFEIFETRWIEKGEEVNLLPKVIFDEFQKGFETEEVRFLID